MTYVPANEVEVGDIIWDAQEHVVTKVQHLSVSTAITARRIDQPAGGGSVQWLYGNDWPPIPVTRRDGVFPARPDNGPGEVI